MTYPQRWRPAFSSVELATFLSIVLALILMAPIAFASPPDPSWIVGIFDGADGDDVVSLVYETAGVEAVSLRSVLPLSRACNVSLESKPGAVHGFPLHEFPRGPPFPVALIISDVRSRLRRPCHIPRPYRPEQYHVPFDRRQAAGRCFVLTGGGAVTEGEHAVSAGELSCRGSRGSMRKLRGGPIEIPEKGGSTWMNTRSVS